MKPKYLLELADMVDPDHLWSLGPLDRLELPEEKRKQLDAGVALRRYAAHMDRLQKLVGSGRALVLTPLNSTTTSISTIEAPNAAPITERLD